MATKRLQAVPTKLQTEDELLLYWQKAIGRYIKTKREQAEKTQSEVMGTSRSAISDLENHLTDFRLSSLLKVLEAVGGDISEAFESKAPTEYRGRHRDLFDLLAEVVEFEDRSGLMLVRSALETAQKLGSRKRQKQS